MKNINYSYFQLLVQNIQKMDGRDEVIIFWSKLKNLREKFNLQQAQSEKLKSYEIIMNEIKIIN